MNFRVLKFGGSSVSGATNISRVLDIVEAQAADSPVVLVLSAIAGCTDALLAGALAPVEKRHRAIVNRLFTGAERNAVQALIDGLFREAALAPRKEIYGELLSTTIVAEKLKACGIPTLWLDSRKLIVKDKEKESFSLIREAFRGREERVFVVPGFICSNGAGEPDTLGRGGSDYSAALFAAALGAESLQIWTDVPGIMTANPRQVPPARTIPQMSYSEAFAMASAGAKVLYAPTVAPAMEAGIDIEIRNTFAPDGAYTVIGVESAGPLVGIATLPAGEDVSISIIGKQLSPSFCEGVLRDAGISALKAEETQGGILLKVKPKLETLSLKVLHRALFETPPVTTVPIFIAGEGAVGKALVEMIERSASSLAKRSGKRIVIAGTASSTSYRLALGGVTQSTPRKEGSLIDAMCRLAPQGSVFVDATPSETIHAHYSRILSAGISIVSANRRALAVPYVEFTALKALARENGLFFRYETTVGAALPILEALSRGEESRDSILSLEAVVSCTLNQVLSEYEPGKRSFASCLRKAQEDGLTEKDPRMDIGGEDALRKLLILSREAGVPLEREDVIVEPIVPRSFLLGTLETFYKDLDGYEDTISQMVCDAAREGKRLRFVSSLEKTDTGFKASISIKAVPQEHPAHYLKGTENAFIIKSVLRPYPLVIKGPGEGPQEASSSLLVDILR